MRPKLVQIAALALLTMCLFTSARACRVHISLGSVFPYTVGKQLDMHVPLGVNYLPCECDQETCRYCLDHHEPTAGIWIDYSLVGIYELKDLKDNASLHIDNVLMQSLGLASGIHSVAISTGCDCEITEFIDYRGWCCWGQRHAGWYWWDWDGLISLEGMITPVSRNEASRTVTYSADFTVSGVGLLFGLQGGSYVYRGPDGSSGSGALTVPAPAVSPFTSDVSVVFADGPVPVPGWGWNDSYDLTMLANVPEDPGSGPGDVLAVDKFGGDSTHVTPIFNIESVTASTSPDGNSQGVIEPAYGDNVTFHWKKNYCEFHAESIVILKQDTTGTDLTATIEDPDWPGARFSLVETVPLSESTNVDQQNGQTGSWTITGDLTWPEPGTYRPIFPSGRYRVGVRYDNGNVRVADDRTYVDVGLSVYDVYTDNHAPFYLGDGTEGKTSIYYKMSAQAQEGKVNVSIGGVKTVQGTPSSGQNALTDVWDGTISPGNYVDGGEYGLTFDVTPLSGSVGPLLSISSISHDSSFVPASNETLTIGFDIHEPVRRPQSTHATLTAIIYDSEGDLVRLLANRQQASIDNQADLTDGHNELVWDGMNEQHKIVEPGAYTLVLLAKDNAGARCESGATTTEIIVSEPPQSEAVLVWPIDLDGLDTTNLPSGIPGYTDSGSSVLASVDGATETIATAYGNGAFFVVVPQTPGNHTVALRTASGTFPEKQISVSFFVNDASVSSPASGSTFDPQANGSIPVTYDSETVDAVDVYVYDPFDQSACNDTPNPVPAADIMNGIVSTKLIRTVAVNQPVATGANTIQWDGKNDAGQFATPGLYDIVIKRHNADGLLGNETSVRVVIEHSAGAPTISGIASHIDGPSCSVTWNTDVPTTGCLGYEVDGNPTGKMRATGDPSTQHTVWLSGTTPNTNYSYYVIATNPTTGAGSVSQQQSAITGSGVQIGKITATAKSPTETQISYGAGDPVTAAVEYAQVGPGISSVQWHKAEHSFCDQQHVFNLTGLQANAEYAYRIISSADSHWTSPARSPFRWFATSTALPSVEFRDVENGQGVDSLGTVTVRASGVQPRFSTYGITKAELFIDSEQAIQCTKSSTSNYVDYAFNLSSLNLQSGVHDIVAVVYDDYWQTSTSHIVVLLNSPLQQSSSLAEPHGRAMALDATSSSGDDVPKKQRHTVTIRPLLNLIWRGDDWPGHAFMEFTDPKIRSNEIPRRAWKGFATDDWRRFVDAPCPGYVRDERKGKDGTGEEGYKYHRYAIRDMTWNELTSLSGAIEKSRSHPPTYETYPHPDRTHNCVTWIQRMLSNSGIDDDERAPFGQQAYFLMPAEVGDLAVDVNAGRKIRKEIQGAH